MKLTSLAKDLEPYIIKLIRKIVGEMQFAGIRTTTGLAYRLRLVDQSEREIAEYVVYALGGGEYADIYTVMLAAGAGDAILVPVGTFQDWGDTGDGSTSDISFVGQSRTNTIIDGNPYFAGGGGSIENMTLIESFSSAADIHSILLYGAGTVHLNDIHVEMTQTGTGDVQGISAEHGSAIIHVWNSYIKSNASGAGAGYAAYAGYSGDEVHFHNCHLVYNDAIEDPGGSGTVYLHGCTTETI